MGRSPMNQLLRRSNKRRAAGLSRKAVVQMAALALFQEAATDPIRPAADDRSSNAIGHNNKNC